jgi:hypothetical protein
MAARQLLRVHIKELDASTLLNHELQELLRRNILIEWSPTPDKSQRDILAFAHNLLFDYAVGRLLFFSDVDHFIAHLESPEIDSILAIRPSIVLSYQHYWYQGAMMFWDVIFRVERSTAIPEIVRLIGPSVASELLSDPDQWQPLLAGLTEGLPQAQSALTHLVGSQLAAYDSPRARGDLWAILACDVSLSLTDQVAYALTSLLNVLSNPAPESYDTRSRLGTAARRLVAFVRMRDRYDAWLARNALMAVCRTYCTAIEQSSASLQPSLRNPDLTLHGHQEIPAVAQEVQHILGCDPVFSAELYRVVFSHTVASDETTSMGDSQRILNFTSTKRQDYDLGRYLLSQEFPDFLRRWPSVALNMLISLVHDAIESDHQRRTDEPIEQFSFFGRLASCKPDNSEVWDTGEVYSQGTAFGLLDLFDAFLLELGQRPDASGTVSLLISTIAERNVYAAMWRRLLHCGARDGHGVGIYIWELARTRSILIGFDTYHAAGEYLKSVFSLLSEDQRREIEQTILDILVDHRDGESRKSLAWHRKRLLGCLPAESVTRPEMRELIRSAAQTSPLPDNRPPVVISGGARALTSEDHLAFLGVPVDDSAARRMIEITRPVEEFTSRYLNTSPSLDEVRASFPYLEQLRRVLSPSARGGTHPKQLDAAWSWLAEACARIVQTPDALADPHIGPVILQSLVETSTSRAPVFSAKSAAQFAKSPSWGLPSARIAAASGLARLPAAFLSPTVKRAIKRLARDKAPQVRYQIGVHLLYLYHSDPDLLWKLRDYFGRKEANNGVLSGVTPVFARLASRFPEKIVPLAIEIYRRLEADGGDGTDSPLVQCISILPRRGNLWVI